MDNWEMWIVLLFLVLWIYTTHKHIQKRKREDDEHSRQIKRRSTANHDEFERIEQRNETWLSISDAVAVVSIFGSVVFIIKLSADFYYARRKDKREQELHDRQMK